MKKILQCALIFAICLITFNSSAQNRYLEEVFTGVTVESNVKYAENFTVITGAPVLENLLMDVYTPDGDTEDMRPLIILGHAGSYLPKGLNTLPFGNKVDSSLVEMCTQFAKRGWVAVSMNYRLGWNPVAPTQEERAGTIMNAVYRSMQDARTCVRFFQEDAANANVYKVDTTKITVGGSNTGGYMALAAAYLDKVEEMNLFKFRDSDGNSFINQAVTGGFYGEGGMTGVNNHSNPGHSSEIQLVLNFGGAIGDTSWMEAGDIPVVGFHGVQDVTTPYKTAVVIVLATGQPIVEVSGAHDFVRYANTLGLNQVFIEAGFDDPYTLKAQSHTPYEGLFPFPGLADGLEPWAWYDSSDVNTDHETPGATGFGSRANPYATKEKALAFIDTMMGYFCPRAVVALNLGAWPLGIERTSSPEFLHIYPNPVTSSVFIESSSDDPILSIELYNMLGQLVRRDPAINAARYRFERDDIPSGFYLLNVTLKNRKVVKKIMFK
ncbi:MAG TPA: T9SS type A sorting domain-containing protein [Bacteroides sp.]|nr:T9SS type A sorting domain-containing protein [Bacteroides sp.]